MTDTLAEGVATTGDLLEKIGAPPCLPSHTVRWLDPRNPLSW